MDFISVLMVLQHVWGILLVFNGFEACLVVFIGFFMLLQHVQWFNQV